MMAITMELALTVVLLFPLLLPVVSTQTTYHIRPTSESPCPYQDCLTLSEYAMETSRYTNSNNLTLLFLSGEHVLNTSIEFQLLDSLSLLGDRSTLLNITSKIMCNGTVGFHLANMSYVQIKGLLLSNCGGHNNSHNLQWPILVNVTAAMNLGPSITALHLFDFHIISCCFMDGYFPLMLNKSRAYVKDSTFSYNKGVFGGAIAAYDSAVVFLGQNMFLSNEALVGGGVFAYNTSLVCMGSTLYVNNTAEYGGSITALYSTFTFENASMSTGINTFLGNLAQYDGGGILLVNSTLMQNGGYVNFTGNRAGNGSAISSHQSHISLNSFAMFERNSAVGLGGAVSVRNGNLSSAIISFMDNSAESGGAVYAEYSKLSFGLLEDGVSAKTISKTFSGHVNFINNEAFNSGGGILLNESSTLNISGSGTYVGNTANQYGGMICAQSHSSVTLNGKNAFTGNRAQRGGAIAITKHGLYSSYCKLGSTGRCSVALFSGSISLLRNVAEYDGGGVYFGEIIAQILGNVTYINNTAENGGGMHMTHSKLKTSGIGIYINNTSLYHGGAIFASQSRVIMSGTSTYINNSAIGGDGGVISIFHSDIEFHGVVSFVNNKAVFEGECITVDDDPINNITGSRSCKGKWNWGKHASCGGAISAYASDLLVNGESSFIGNYAWYGGGIAIFESSTGLLLGNISLISNKATVDGGGVYLDDDWDPSALTISGTGTYINNTAGDVGGVIASTESNITLRGKHIFSVNLASCGAAIAATYYSVVMISGTVSSSNNYAAAGGVIYLRSSSLNFTGNATHFNNTASRSGGVILGIHSKLFLDGRSTMARNCAKKRGGAIAVKHCSLFINSCEVVERTPNLKQLTLEGNEANNSGGALYATESHVELCGVTSFVNNMATFGGGLHAVRTGIILNGLQDFRSNSASYGGGMAIESYVNGGFLSISQIAYLLFANNSAQDHGGALFVSDSADYTCPPSGRIPERRCFVNFGKITDLPHVRLPYGRFRNDTTRCIGHAVFEGNLANDGGHVLFGGAMYNCRVDIRFEESCEYSGCKKETCYMSGIEAVAALTHSSVQKLTRDPFSVMSDTYKVCICATEKPNCNHRASNFTIYPGETISVSVTVVGKQELITLVANVIQAQINGSQRVWLDKGQDTQAINDSCSMLEYTLFAAAITSAKLTLSVDGPCHSSGLSHYIYLSVLKCPVGFYSSFGSCICERRLQRYTNTCDINTRAITRNGDFWVGFDHHSHGLILHPHCAFDYCKLETASFTLNSTDLQCAQGRSGILCGACKSGYSLNLGSSQCTSCSNVSLLLFIPFAIAGFLLVVFLFICKVTVAAGTISGLIFYANILAVNKTVFFAAGETNILTVFIAWLNLDLGVETCFTDGMDMYTRTWLQFAFPLYIWLLVGIIALVSHHSTFIARIIGPTNPVSVLATLFHLSYTKLLRTIIATLSFTTLDYPDDKSVTVWVYDGNVEYFKGKHIPLFLAGLLAFLLLFLPYTLLLLFGQWIEAGSRHKLLSWVNKPIVKYFLDAYHAPYKNQHRYWTGLLLLVRFVLFIISAVVDINSPRDPSINFLVLGVVCVGLMAVAWNIGSMYKKWIINFLESSFILNLAILALASYQVKVEGGNQTAVVYTSVSIAFVTFLGIITYHVVELLRESRVWRITILPKLQRLKQSVTHHEEQHDTVEMTSHPQMTAAPTAPLQPVPTTFIELREPLLESQH